MVIFHGSVSFAEGILIFTDNYDIIFMENHYAIMITYNQYSQIITIILIWANHNISLYNLNRSAMKGDDFPKDLTLIPRLRENRKIGRCLSHPGVITISYICIYIQYSIVCSILYIYIYIVYIYIYIYVSSYPYIQIISRSKDFPLRASKKATELSSLGSSKPPITLRAALPVFRCLGPSDRTARVKWEQVGNMGISHPEPWSLHFNNR